MSRILAVPDVDSVTQGHSLAIKRFVFDLTTAYYEVAKENDLDFEIEKTDFIQIIGEKDLNYKNIKSTMNDYYDLFIARILSIILQH